MGLDPPIRGWLDPYRSWVEWAVTSTWLGNWTHIKYLKTVASYSNYNTEKQYTFFFFWFFFYFQEYQIHNLPKLCKKLYKIQIDSIRQTVLWKRLIIKPRIVYKLLSTYIEQNTVRVCQFIVFSFTNFGMNFPILVLEPRLMIMPIIL